MLYWNSRGCLRTNKVRRGENNPRRKQAECQVKHDYNDTHLKYLDILCSLCGSNREAFHATARQRAESFMRVKGLWK